MITWTDREKLEFRLVNAHDVSYLWGHLNGKENMTYAKFSRAIRYYYGKGVIEKVNIFKLSSSISRCFSIVLHLQLIRKQRHNFPYRHNVNMPMSYGCGQRN